MLPKNPFKKNANELEDSKLSNVKPNIPDAICHKCPKCKFVVLSSEVKENLYVCPRCKYNFRINARTRIKMITDDSSFKELFSDLSAKNVLDFPGYENKLKSARLKSREKDAVVTGTAKICGNKCAIFVMDHSFMMGSMGSVVGEKITRLFEYAIEEKLPVIGYTVSGGARMQEGIISLMQMAKTSGAVKKHSDAGGLYIAVLTDPTTGGVTASFAMQADITIAEPDALIGFAGPRVIEQTIRQKLPEGFQRSEFLLEKGFVDQIVSRNSQRETLGKLLSMHK